MTKTLNTVTGRYEYDPIPVAKKPKVLTLWNRISTLERQVKYLLSIKS